MIRVSVVFQAANSDVPDEHFTSAMEVELDADFLGTSVTVASGVLAELDRDIQKLVFCRLVGANHIEVTMV